MRSISKKRKTFHKQILAAAALLMLAGRVCGAQSFSAVLPVRPQADLEPRQVLELVIPVLRANGFRQGPHGLALPAGPLRLEPVDLAGLATEVCREPLLQADAASREVCAAMTSGHASPAAEAAFQAAYGASFAEYRDRLERVTFQYTFPQVVDRVPIEGAGVFVFRRQGETPSVVHGSLFNRFVLLNRPGERGSDGALIAARRRLLTPFGDRPVLVLLPGGTGRTQGGAEVPALRYAWRTLLRSPGRRRSWMAWIDAASGDVLRLAPQWSHAANAKGERWRRDPGLCAVANPSCTEVVPFEVDPPVGGRLKLQLKGVFGRLDLGADDVYGPQEVDVPAESQTFLRDWIRKKEDAVCAAGKNSGFRQVHAYSHLHSLWRRVADAGILPAMPEKPIQTYLDVEDDGYGSMASYDDDTGKEQSILWFVYGKGFTAGGCPNEVNTRLNAVHDVTTLAHEMSHLNVWRLQERRPKDWCKAGDCEVPNVAAHSLLHGFADALAFSYASTNCFSGWTDKNWGGKDKARYCADPALTSEKGSFPRLAHVGDSLSPAAPGDHFPEHRLLDKGNYADGQIAAAALWKVRQGLRSKLPAAGTVEHWARLQRAIWGFGFLSLACTEDTEPTEGMAWRACDLGIYQALRDLETRMVEQWAAPPAAGADLRHAANKVLAGWAKAGIFLTPPECIDGTGKPHSCRA